MEAPMVYPTDPFHSRSHRHDIDGRTAHSGASGESAESAGTAKSMLGKVKRKARKLKDKVKKVTGSNTTTSDYADDNEHAHKDFNDVPSPDSEEVDDEEDESYEEDGKTADNQFKYEQLRSIGALDEQGDGSAAEVHGGVPVSTLTASPGAYWKSTNEYSAPISPYKSAGPSDTLQATPTEYCNYATNDDSLLVGGEEKTASTSDTTNGLVEDPISRGSDEQRVLLGLSLPEINISNSSSYHEPPNSSSYHEPSEPRSENGISDTVPVSDMNVPYPEDLVKPNPSFGQSSSPTHDKIAVMNEDFSTDRKLGVGLSSENHSCSRDGNLLGMSVPEFEVLSGYQGRPSVGAKVDELVYKPIPDAELGSESFVGSFLTPLPGILDGDEYKPTAIAHSSGTSPNSRQHQDSPGKAVDLPGPGVDKMAPEGESGTYMAGAHASEKGCGDEQKPVSSTANTGEKLPDGGILTAPDICSSNDINDAKDAVDNGLIGANQTDESKTQPNKMAGVLEDVNKEDAEEEFFNPNEVKDNQFQEGFALGSAEKDALSGTLAGSAIETLQGLKETVASSLGYSTNDHAGAGGEKNAGSEGTFAGAAMDTLQGLKETVASSLGYSTNDYNGTGGERNDLSGTHQQQKGGFVQGMKETVASSLGYSKPTSEEDSGNVDVSERGETLALDADEKQQQSGGAVQGWTQDSPVEAKGKMTSYAEASSHEPVYDEDGREHGIRAGHVLSDANAHREDEVSSQQQSSGVLQGVKDKVISKLGYSNQPD